MNWTEQNTFKPWIQTVIVGSVRLKTDCCEILCIAQPVLASYSTQIKIISQTISSLHTFYGLLCLWLLDFNCLDKTWSRYSVTLGLVQYVLLAACHSASDYEDVLSSKWYISIHCNLAGLFCWNCKYHRLIIYLLFRFWIFLARLNTMFDVNVNLTSDSFCYLNNCNGSMNSQDIFQVWSQF